MSRKSHLSLQSQTGCGVTSAREIAESYGLPFEITAKTLQRLKDTGLIQSAQGARGGYTLKRALAEVSLAEFLQLMEGPQSVVACASGEAAVVEAAPAPSSSCSCEYRPKCDIKSVMGNLNAKVLGFLSGIRLAEIVENYQQATAPAATSANTSFLQGNDHERKSEASNSS
jgi:Rrf2 family protein